MKWSGKSSSRAREKPATPPAAVATPPAAVATPAEAGSGAGGAAYSSEQKMKILAEYGTLNRNRKKSFLRKHSVSKQNIFKWKNVSTTRRLKSNKGRYAIVDATAKDLLKLEFKNLVIKKKPPTLNEARNLVNSAAKDTLLRCHNKRRAKNVIVRSALVRKLLKEFTVKQRVKDTTAARALACSDVFNTITFVACKEALKYPYPVDHPTFSINPNCDWNTDATGLFVDSFIREKEVVYVPKEQAKDKTSQVRRVPGSDKKSDEATGAEAVKGAPAICWKYLFAGARDGTSAPVVFHATFPDIPDGKIIVLKLAGFGATSASEGYVWLSKKYPKGALARHEKKVAKAARKTEKKQKVATEKAKTSTTENKDEPAATAAKTNKSGNTSEQGDATAATPAAAAAVPHNEAISLEDVYGKFLRDIMLPVLKRQLVLAAQDPRPGVDREKYPERAVLSMDGEASQINPLAQEESILNEEFRAARIDGAKNPAACTSTTQAADNGRSFPDLHGGVKEKKHQHSLLPQMKDRVDQALDEAEKEHKHTFALETRKAVLSMVLQVQPVLPICLQPNKITHGFRSVGDEVEECLEKCTSWDFLTEEEKEKTIAAVPKCVARMR